jgi:putative cell wall-binding protein
MGFSVDDAMYAQRVTIVGGTSGVSAEAEAKLRAAGCQVERIPGETPELIKAIFDELVASGQPFLNGS